MTETKYVMKDMGHHRVSTKANGVEITIMILAIILVVFGLGWMFVRVINRDEYCGYGYGHGHGCGYNPWGPYPYMGYNGCGHGGHGHGHGGHNGGGREVINVYPPYNPNHGGGNHGDRD